MLPVCGIFFNCFLLHYHFTASGVLSLDIPQALLSHSGVVVGQYAVYYRIIRVYISVSPSQTFFVLTAKLLFDQLCCLPKFPPKLIIHLSGFQFSLAHVDQTRKELT